MFHCFNLTFNFKHIKNLQQNSCKNFTINFKMSFNHTQAINLQSNTRSNLCLNSSQKVCLRFQSIARLERYTIRIKFKPRYDKLIALDNRKATRELRASSQGFVLRHPVSFLFVNFPPSRCHPRSIMDERGGVHVRQILFVKSRPYRQEFLSPRERINPNKSPVFLHSIRKIDVLRITSLKIYNNIIFFKREKESIEKLASSWEKF